MPTTTEKLEDLFAKVRALSPERQKLAVEALSEIADQAIYILSSDERSALEPALARAQRGEFASEEDVDKALNKPWS